MAKSLSIAYVCCIFGGLFGLHHFYLGRDRQGIIYFTTLGGFLIGLAYDLFKMPDYVNEANLDRSYLIDLKRSMNSEPSFTATRFISCLVVGTFFNYLVSNCIHFDNSQEELRVLLILIVPLIESFAVHFIGTDGPYACDFRWPLIGSYITMALRMYNSTEDVFYYPLVSTILLGARIKWDETYLDRQNSDKQKLGGRVLKIFILTSFFMVLIGLFTWNNLITVTKDGEAVSLKESAFLFFNGDEILKLRNGLKWVWDFYDAHGFTKLIEFMFYIDPGKNKNSAYNEIGLKESSSQQEVDDRCKLLARQLHPDKFTDPEEKQMVEAKFMRIQESCNLLSSKRKKKNKKKQPI